MKTLITVALLTASFTLTPSELTASIVDEVEHKVMCLAKNIYFEARGESRIGMLAVAHVTINRWKSPKYPDTLCGVVYEKNQFSWTRKERKITDAHAFSKAKRIAHDVIMGKTKDPTRGATSFHSSKIPSPWKKIPRVTIGNHIFY